MIALDTNVLVRVFVDDPGNPEQVRAAREKATAASQVFVPQVVQVEAVWVFQRAFGLSKSEIVRILRHMASNAAFVLERSEIFLDALGAYEGSRLGFSDCVILREAAEADVRLASFDMAFKTRTEVDILRA